MSSPFVNNDSIVRKIWGNADTVLLIFAGAAAEFPLNKAVDWLYYTGRLPADPLGRLFSTVQYAQQIVFSGHEEALAAIDRITAIHKAVEASRGDKIPDVAYLDVLFMLIDYSIRSAELMGRKLNIAEKMEIFDVFHRVGSRMGLKRLPPDYERWLIMRSAYLQPNLLRSTFTEDLYRQYKRHLGAIRYYILLQAQAMVAPAKVRKLLSLPSLTILYPVLLAYKVFRILKFDKLIKALLLPAAYKVQIASLDRG
ncbi:oxygenase MpaB family protein [Flavitalea sp. BT771]|uniref:oxygenase MpaB family protein n=1 Tax=Flavitalea sp. BT771 TaxID=3063329 RepID=UPI0026E17F2E|nr:oxygenase MpaB family protein [Flavitalea sp. BT771]MDO6434539.1 oxygenase MpaB family protein [Flavitalea sp. BT771]MDV6223439.1 oxygenase MpaB family protein [Flavitalea sp. BT771]